jgi:hypothetical protein
MVNGRSTDTNKFRGSLRRLRSLDLAGPEPEPESGFEWIVDRIIIGATDAAIRSAIH